MTCLVIATLLAAAADPEPESAPKGPPPRVVALPDGFIDGMFLRVTDQVPVTVKERRLERIDGKTVEKTVTVTRIVPETRMVRIAAKASGARTAGGKKLDADEVARRLGRPQVVLISSDGKPVDPAYLRLYKPDTLVIETPGAPEPDRPKDFDVPLRRLHGD